MQGVPLSQSWYPSFKHSDDYWFLKSAVVHPMRVSNPQDAKLFFVPFLLNAVSEVKNNYTSDENGVLRPATFCVHGRCSNETNMIAWANDLLGNSTYFQRHGGRDHILVASHYHHPRELEKDTFSNLRKCSVVSFENYQKLCHKGLNRCLKLLEMPKPRLLQVDPEFLPNVSLPSLYVGRPCQQHYHHYSQNTTITRTTTSTRNLQSNNGNDNKNDNNNNNNSHKKTADFAMVASMMGKPIRQKLCRWLDDAAATAGHNQSYYNFSTSLCGEGPQCPALAQARYGFHVQGDSHGSNRPMDTLLSATIPIFTNEAQYNILPDFYYYHDDHNRRSASSSLWRQVSFFVPLSTSFSNFSQALQQILEQPDSVYEEKMELIAKYRDWFDYSSGVPFDKYMAEFARRILPLQD